MTTLPTYERLRELFDFDDVRGKLIWKSRTENKSWNTRYAGTIALNTMHPKGYRYGTIDGKTYRTHRIIFKWIHGFEPDKIDHINGKRSDNTEGNIRSVDVQTNQKNLKIREDNKSGVVGVQYRKDINKWRAYINVERKQISLGTYPSFDEACDHRKNAEEFYGFHKNHGRKSDE